MGQIGRQVCHGGFHQGLASATEKFTQIGKVAFVRRERIGGGTPFGAHHFQKTFEPRAVRPLISLLLMGCALPAPPTAGSAARKECAPSPRDHWLDEHDQQHHAA